MGGKITRPGDDTGLVRAKSITEALKRRSPILSLATEPWPDFAAEGSGVSLNNPEVHQAFLEQLVECTPEAISILDPHQRILRVNGEFTRMFGFDLEETIGKSIDSMIVPPERTSEMVSIGQALGRGEKVGLSTQRHRKDGTLVDVFISCAPVFINGVQVAVYALYRDISEEKRAEVLSSALYRIAEKTSSAEDLQQFYTAIHGIVGELIFARNFYIAVYDPVTELLSFPYFVDQQDTPPPPKKLGRGLTEYVLRSGEPLLCVQEVFDRLVKLGEVELIGTPSLDWLGVPLKAASRTFGVLVLQSYTHEQRFHENDKDILTFVSQHLATAIQHKYNAVALRHSEARYRSLIEKAAYGIYCCTFEGKFLDVNPALIAMLGYTSVQELLALDPRHDIFLDPAEQEHMVREFRKDTRLENVEVRWKRKDKKAITVRLSGRVVGPPEATDDVLEIIAEDVTERRALEDQFRQAQKMEAVGRLAGGVAHDFNNLLMVISGYSEVLIETASREDESFPKLQAIQQAADRASSLTRQLLAFSRKQMLELKIVDVNMIVGDMDRLLRPLIGENVSLHLQLASDLGHVRADSGQVEQVIMNLVVNSKDAMPNGGTITINTTNVVVDKSAGSEHSYIRQGTYVVLSVSDTGCGMDRETESRIFEPFFTTKEKGKGTGLGLSTVYGIVKQSGGYIVAKSELGSGTTFQIYLPRVEDAADPVAQASTTKSMGGSETILLVEDEASVRQLVRETLEIKGYTVLEAHDGETALRIALQHRAPIHMLITDVVMPGMSGRELAQRICASDPDVKVLYLSGYTEDTIVHEGGLEPGTAFLQKPFTLQTLSRRVREVLRSLG
jgi:two-component system, cell cycle sensor histidine kinase and response regulator CckA